MKLKNSRTNHKIISSVLASVCAVLLVLTFMKVVSFAADSASTTRLVRQITGEENPQDDKLEKYLAERKEMSAALKQRNLFVPSARPKQPVCYGILGDKALMNEHWHRVGDTVDGAKIIEIGPEAVTVQWQDEKMELKPIQAKVEYATGEEKPRPSESGREEPGGKDKNASKAAEQPVHASPGAPQGRGRGGFRNPFADLSPEEREEMRQRIMNMSPEERRDYFRQMRDRFRSR